MEHCKSRFALAQIKLRNYTKLYRPSSEYMLPDCSTIRALRKHFLAQDGLTTQIISGRVDRLLYYLEGYFVLLTEMRSKGQYSQCTVSVLMANT